MNWFGENAANRDRQGRKAGRGHFTLQNFSGISTQRKSPKRMPQRELIIGVAFNAPASRSAFHNRPRAATR